MEFRGIKDLQGFWFSFFFKKNKQIFKITFLDTFFDTITTL